jgi:hypothetical protein
MNPPFKTIHNLIESQTLYEEYNSATSTAEDVARNKALVWKQDLRIVPLSAGIYLLCYLDRSNIGEFLVFLVYRSLC